MELGEKIRRRRTELGMTQAALCGDTVTRNMLSQIESGKAGPSLATLRYFAERLGVPVGYFFCEEEDEFFYRKQTCFSHLRELFLSGSWVECLRVFEKELGYCDDELGLMMAICAYKSGKKAWNNGAMESAVGYLQSALDYCEETAYPTDGIRAGCEVLMPIALNVQAPLLEFNEHAYIDHLRDAGCMDVYCYLTEREGYAFENPFYAEHLKARELMRKGDCPGAIERLCAVETQKGAEGITAFLLFRVYTDMEVCYREVGNYEAAYRYSSKRMTLLSAFRS